MGVGGRWLAAAVLSSLSIAVSSDAARVNPLASIKTWAVYYGEAPETAATLARFDLVVLDATRRPPLPEVKRFGALVLAYASLGEINVHHPRYAEVKDAPWVLGANPQWPDARKLDPRDPAYARWLLDGVVADALAAPVHGVFLDTADTVLELEATEPARFAGAGAALERVVRELRARHPQALVVLNAGLPIAARVGAVLDGVALESVWTDYDFAAKRYLRRDAAAAAARAASLSAVARAGVRGLVLEYTDGDDGAWTAELLGRARGRGFVPYVSTIALDRVFTSSLGTR